MINSQKKALRKYIRKKRYELSENELISQSSIIINKILRLNEFINSSSILVYISMPGEVITTKLIKTELSEEKIISVPVVKENEKDLYLTKLSSDHKSELLSNSFKENSKFWKQSNFGVLEPTENSLDQTDINKIDLIIVPGLAFDRTCMRLGYGGGYYDRLLSKRNKNTIAVAVGFNFQIIDNVPFSSYDQKVDLIITENDIINIQK